MKPLVTLLQAVRVWPHLRENASLCSPRKIYRVAHLTGPMQMSTFFLKGLCHPAFLRRS